MVVEVMAPSTTLGVTAPVNVGGRNVNEHVAGGVCVDMGLMMEIVVWLRGEHPTEKLVGLESENVGQADSELTVTVICEVHPFTRLVVTIV